MGKQSKYNSTENLKITYFLGAGASYNALPIWKAQGESMVMVADHILFMIHHGPTETFKKEYPDLLNSKILIEFMTKLKNFGELAQEYGSIDIYAKRLYLIGDDRELNELKYCLSVYFDLWENFLYKGNRINEFHGYTKIDKRYLSLLSVILEKVNDTPFLHQNISFLTWNYDLQLETAFESFLRQKTKSLNEIDRYLQFMDSDSASPKRVYHLNGFRGIFLEEKKYYETVEKRLTTSLESYLVNLASNFSQFKNPTFHNCIKYAWESDSDAIKEAKTIMAETNILIIVGYSFPAFNRKLDQELIKYFETNRSKYSRVIYQDPFANQDIVNSLFSNPEDVEIHKENTSQFYIPHEFLSPAPGAKFDFRFST